MDGGVNGNTAVRPLPGSGIPAPQSLLRSSKLSLKHPDSGLRPDATHLPAFTRVSSSSSFSRGPAKPNQQKSGPFLGVPSYRAASGSENGSQTHPAFRKEVPSETHQAPLYRGAVGELRRDVNENCPSGCYGHGGVDNAASWGSGGLGPGGAPPSGVSGFGETRPSGLGNRNRPSAEPASSRPSGGQNREARLESREESGCFSDEEMGSPGDASPEFRPPPTAPLSAGPAGEGVLTGGHRAAPPPRVNMAAVAPFRHRLQVRGTGDLSTLKELTEPSSVAMETSCKDLGLLLRTSARGRDQDLKTDSADGSRTEGKAPAMAAKRGKPGAPQGGAPRGELRVFRAGSQEGRLPVPSSLRKQKSLTNLAVLTDAEKKMQLYQPEWRDDMGKPGTGSLRAGKAKAGAGGGPAPLSRNLSKSEHSLFQGKPRPFSPLAAPAALGKQSRIPRGPYAEVKPLSKAPDDGKSDDEILSGKAKAEDKKPAPGGGAGEGGAKGQGGEGDKPFLKVDPELVVTVLGDLEQLLFSQMLDPESQRKRTVQNVLDLRQNLEDTMSSLRGAQLSHSCMETGVCYDSDETNARSVSSTSNRSSPLSWRYGQSSPRLQAGDAPSSTGGGYHGGQGPAQYASRTMPARNPSRLGHASRGQLIEGPDADDPDLKSGYLSDSDLVSKSLNEDDDLGNGWDESSSISSGLSDGSDNLSSEDFNASSSLNSLPTTPVGSRRNSSVVLRTDAEKRSLAESGLSWYSEDGRPPRKGEGGGGYDTGSLKTESSAKWRKCRPLEGGGEDAEGKAELKKPQSLGQPGTFKKSRNPPVGVTSPITHTSHSLLRVAAQKPDQKPVDKAKVAVKASGLQRSCSDAGRDRGKPPSGLVRPTAAGAFGYKKPPAASGTATVMSASGATISSGSATVGKTPRSSGIPIKPLGGGGGGGGGLGGDSRKSSLDVSNLEPGFLSPSARGSIQYRSLPRPAKSSAMSLTGRPASRPVSSTVDSALLGLKPAPSPGPSLSPAPSPALSPTPSCSTRMKELGGGGGKANRASVGPVNQTDREKEKAKAKAVASSDSDCGSLKGLLAAGEASAKLQGLRQSSGSKYSELSSPVTHRALGSKSLGRPPSLAHGDKVNSLDSCLGLQDLPPKVPPFSKLQDLAGSCGTPRLTPSPAPVLHIDSPGCFSGSPLLYPRLSGMHRSLESLPMHLSVPPSPVNRQEEQEERGGGPGVWGPGSRTSITLPDSLQRDRNTLPKKGLSRYSQPEEEVKKEGKERRHSHTIVSITDSESPPRLPSPPSASLSVGKNPPTNVVAPTPNGGTPPRITRSNSIPTHDSAFELYGASPLGSSLSLADRPKSMIRSGSFREPGEDVHGSVLSLASSASSSYSSAEERMQGEQIRKLRRELETSQEKVATLTCQLSENLGQANLVAAFEQSLALMTSRLQSLSVTAEQKDTELLDLRETIEVLKTKNTEAQTIIHGALSTADLTPKSADLRIKRQNSSESISSLNSITSLSSVGSCKDADAKKRKKKSWLRSSFNKAFSIKKGPKSGTSYSDIEEIATPDSSAPSSPKLSHDGGENPPSSLRSPSSASSSVIFEGAEEAENDEKVVSDLRSELWEKERKLTDIRLEALSSAHQLEQLQEAMNSMQMTVENLKAENDQLKGSPAPGPASSSQSHASGLTPLLTSSPRLSAAMSLTKSFSLSLNEGKDPDVTPMEAVSHPANRDDVRLRVVVRLGDQRVFKDEVKQLEFFIGWVRMNGRTDWATLDTAISQVFKDYIAKVDPTSSLVLSVDSIYCYHVSHIKRVMGGEVPEATPLRCLGKSPCSVSVALKGMKEKCVDCLVFETLIPKPMMQHYISLLLKHRRLVLTGPSGTGKTYLTSRLAEYLVERSGREAAPGVAVTFNMHRQSCKDLQLYLSNLANQIDRETSTGDIPLVVILDDISDASSISELVNGALTCKYHKCPYIIGTTNQPVKMTPNHGLHLSFRMVTFSNNVEPANGFLVRYLHRKLMEAENEGNASNENLLRVLDWVPKLWYHLHTFLEKHSTSDFLIGPCFFLSCPVTVEEFRSWFIDLWNHSIIPYLQEGAKDGIKVHGQKVAWEDPVEWVRGTLPWPSAQQDQAKLFHLPPPSTGPGSPGQPIEERPSKETPPSSLESDPLMAMLLKLQEAANVIESPDRETVTDLNLKPTL